jgi:hypothetical protein
VIELVWDQTLAREGRVEIVVVDGRPLRGRVTPVERRARISFPR